jgi:hypothetical protein
MFVGEASGWGCGGGLLGYFVPVFVVGFVFVYAVTVVIGFSTIVDDMVDIDQITVILFLLPVIPLVIAPPVLSLDLQFRIDNLIQFTFQLCASLLLLVQPSSHTLSIKVTCYCACICVYYIGTLVIAHIRITADICGVDISVVH